MLQAQGPGTVSVVSEVTATQAEPTPANNVLSTELLISEGGSIHTIPTLSEWGVLALILLLAIAATGRLQGGRETRGEA
jgi:hypothetical protein